MLIKLAAIPLVAVNIVGWILHVHVLVMSAVGVATVLALLLGDKHLERRRRRREKEFSRHAELLHVVE